MVDLQVFNNLVIFVTCAVKMCTHAFIHSCYQLMHNNTCTCTVLELFQLVVLLFCLLPQLPVQFSSSLIYCMHAVLPGFLFSFFRLQWVQHKYRFLYFLHFVWIQLLLSSFSVDIALQSLLLRVCFNRNVLSEVSP